MPESLQWQLVDQVQFNKEQRSYLVNYNFASDVMLCECTSTEAEQKWFKAGYIHRYFQIPGFPAGVAESKMMGLQNNWVEVSTEYVPFRLFFERVPWIPDLSVKFYAPQSQD